MHDFVQFVQAVAWPLVALTALLILRRDLANLVDEIAESIHRSNKLKYKGFGMAVELACEIAQVAVPAKTSVGLPADGPAAQQEFEKLAVAYRDLKVADYTQRVAERRHLADQLGAWANNLPADRSKLSTGHEGERVALATAILLRPMRGDLTHLLSAASPPPNTVLFKFTGYRIVLALTTSLSGDKISERQLGRIEKVLDAVEQNANAASDPGLQALLDRTRAVVEEMQREIRA